jgi:hypothetical protein
MEPQAEMPRAGSRIRNPQDFYGGLVLAGFSLFAFWASSDLSGMHGFQFGAGTAPRIFAGLLCAIGLGIAALGLMTDGPLVENQAVRGALFGAALIAFFFVIVVLVGNVQSLERYNFPIASAATDMLAFAIARYSLRGPVLITAAVLTFAGCIRSLGLVVTTFITSMLSMAAADKTNWLEAVIWSAALSAFCAGLFKFALNLPLPLWPWS